MGHQSAVRTPSLYSVIPASVRYDNALRPNAKLLYGELWVWAVDEGYCLVTNRHLGSLFDLSAKTVSELLRQLEERGHITTEVERDEETNEVTSRKIWLTGPARQNTPLPPNEWKEGVW